MRMSRPVYFEQIYFFNIATLSIVYLFCNFAKKEIYANHIYIFGFRFMFYSNDHTPIHVHVIKDGNETKYNISPIEQVYNHGFKKHDIALIESIISENEDIITERWKEYFNQK